MEQNTRPDTIPVGGDKMNAGLRIAGALLDNFIFSTAMFILLAPVMLFSVLTALQDHSSAAMFPPLLFITGIFFYAIYFSKDIFDGRSPAKRIIKMQVTDIRTGFPASPLKCVLRNFTLIVWPIDAIAVLIDPKRRIGDLLAGTQVDYTTSPQRRRASFGQMILAFLTALAFCVVISLPFYLLAQYVWGHQQEMIEEVTRY